MANRQTGEVNYILLLLTIVMGVAIGNLLSNWVTARVAAYQLQQAAIALEKEARAQITASEEHLEQAQHKTRYQRSISRTGRYLENSCKEWTSTLERYNSPTAEQEMRKACKRYEDYLSAGVVPNGVLR